MDSSNNLLNDTNVVKDVNSNVAKEKEEPDKISFSFIAGGIFLLLFIILISISIIYVVFFKVKYPIVSCQNNNDCSTNQICESSVCSNYLCSNDSECNGGKCINTFCVNYNCNTSDDCNIDGKQGFACANNICVKVGNVCNSNMDCNGLICNNNVCVQCSNSSDCQMGQGCYQNICSHYKSDDPNDVMISSISHFFDVTFPSSYMCSNCMNNEKPIVCRSNSSCPTSCPYCVNLNCRCSPGKPFENCESDENCESGKCLENNICSYNGGEECLFNYGEGSDTYFSELVTCPSSSPYCSNGKCNQNPINANCGSNYSIINDKELLCNNSSVLGISGGTGYGYFCTNGRCSENSALLNQRCVNNSCLVIDNSNLSCVQVDDPSNTINRTSVCV